MGETEEGLLRRLARRLPGLADRLESDLRYTLAFTRGIRRLGGVSPWSRTTVSDRIERIVDRTPDADALRFGARVLSYRALDERANRYAHWGRSQGLGPGDAIALMMENGPEYVAAVLGMGKIGVVTALINTHLSDRGLAHCLEVSAARLAVVGPEQQDAYGSARPWLERPVRAWVSGDGGRSGEDLAAALEQESPLRVDADRRRDVRADDCFCLIYTSGTSGLPKAAKVSHFRFLSMAAGIGAVIGLEPEDRTYVPLPLYHAAGLALGVGGALATGASAIIAPRFSAGSFWKECIEHGATTVQYIGELCRYLLNQPAGDEERRHSIRCAVGNGLRPDVWEPFQKRFGIPRIVEFYGSTEGNVMLINLDNRVGAVGRMPQALRTAAGVHIVRYDVERAEPVRDEGGHCVRCAPGEVGEAIGRISPLTRFEGYSDPEETERKILRDVFRDGDAYFRTGDLLSCDEEGYFYFIDRIGDTFRWKGENVSTTEVAEVLGVLPAVREATVYGVPVPGVEGRAGMAAVVLEGELDAGALARAVVEGLPAYARPLFPRICERIDATGTFKQLKRALIDEGYDPARVDDPLYFLDAAATTYRLLDDDAHRRIVSGDLRL
jgi:fatty-acyl-CoA synthase